MAHKIIAADLGTSSLKLARFETSFRKAVLVDTLVVPYLATGRPEDRVAGQLVALAQALAAEKYGAEELVIGLPGDAISLRTLDLPFSNPKQIEPVLSYELESLVLQPVEELAVDFQTVGPRQVPPDTGETRVLTCAASRELVARIIRTASELKLPLRGITAAPLAYAAFLGVDAGPGTTLVIDLGHEQSQLCLLRQGIAEMARTIARGGRHVTDCVAAAFRLDHETAERAKLDSGFIAHRSLAQLTPGQARMDAAVREGLRPILRELRQTVAAYRASYGQPVDNLLVTGGTGRLPGLVDYLSEELGIPAAPLPWLHREGWPEGAFIAERGDLLPVAVGMGFAAATQSPQVTFRKGEFAYKSDYSFLRARALQIAASLSLITLFAGVNAWSAIRVIDKEHEQLEANLKRATLEVFNQERTDAAAVSEEVKAGPKAANLPPVPAMTAFDLLEEITRAAPAPDQIRLDISELDIKPKKTVIKGTAESAQHADDFIEGLKKIDCFEEVQKGRYVKQQVLPPPTPPGGAKPDGDAKPMPNELTAFTITIKTTCP